MGSFGQIYLCADICTSPLVTLLVSKERYAIKIEKQQDTADSNNNPNKNLLMKEKIIMEQLSSNPHYPRYQEFGQQDNCNYLIMTYLGRNPLCRSIPSQLRETHGTTGQETLLAQVGASNRHSDDQEDQGLPRE